MSRSSAEHRLQVALMDYLELGGRKDLRWSAIPNGGHRAQSVANALKAEGLRAGNPDAFFMLPEGRTAWLELKAPGTPAVVRGEQASFRDDALRLGHLWACVNNVDDAIHALSSWGVLRSAYSRTEAFRNAAKINLNMARAIT